MEKEFQHFMKRMEKFMGEDLPIMERSIFRDLDDRDLFQVFTEKRIEMMKEIRETRPGSIRELAESLQRDIKNVYEDLCLLERTDLVGFETSGRRKKPFVKRDVVILKFW